MPLACFLTILSLRASTLPQLIFSPLTSNPSSAPFLKWSYTSAWCSSTLVGMHPTCRQVPPRKGSFSTTTVFSPSSPARIAATYPPGPLQMIATSYFATRSLPSTGARTDDQTWWSDCRHTSVTLEETRGGSGQKARRQPFVLRTPFQTDKKPPALTAQTAASQQTRNFNSRLPPSQPPPGSLLRPARSEFSRGWQGCIAASCHSRTPEVL